MRLYLVTGSRCVSPADMQRALTTVAQVLATWIPVHCEALSLLGVSTLRQGLAAFVECIALCSIL